MGCCRNIKGLLLPWPEKVCAQTNRLKPLSRLATAHESNSLPAGGALNTALFGRARIVASSFFLRTLVFRRIDAIVLSTASTIENGQRGLPAHQQQSLKSQKAKIKRGLERSKRRKSKQPYVLFALTDAL
jgi:hypothetical protein